MTLVVVSGAACGGTASDGSSGAGTAETGAEEGGDDEAENPEADKLGCEESWEGWWGEPQADAAPPELFYKDAESRAQIGRQHRWARVDTLPVSILEQADRGDGFRSTLISEEAVLSTGRNLAVSWCAGSIEPNPQGPGGVIDEEKDTMNLERYEFLTSEVEKAARIWERHSRMNFIHLVAQDDRRKPSGGSCDTALEHVWFRAQTRNCDQVLQGRTNVGGENEFDPGFGSPENPDGAARILCVGWKFLEGAPTRVPWLLGHESGHIVGLEHEHVRWDQSEVMATNCGDNDPYVPVSADRTLTPADPWSVMGYPECAGMADSDGASPHDWLGAYYTFNWTERRVRDMSPQAGGRNQRLWAGDSRPGILWYLPFPDRIVEWRFDEQQPDGSLSYEAVDRCLGSGPPCSFSDSGGHWHPVMGQFSGSFDALDVFMYSPDGATDVLLRNRSAEGLESLERVEATAPNRAVPVVGNFGLSSSRDQILWYRPGPAGETLWAFDEGGQHEVVEADVDQSGWRIPLVGHYRNRSHWADIIWFDPRDATVESWQFNHDFSSAKSGPASAELLGIAQNTEYLPIIGNFDGDNRTDLFWYAPGPAPDWLWLSISAEQAVIFESHEFAVDGEYHPVTGDFDADGDDDLLWYRPAAEAAGGPSYLWYFDGASVQVQPVMVRGDYVPYVEDFDGDGCTDILWYDPVAPANPSPVWRCVPEDKTFSCTDPLPTPKAGYPVAFATGGY